MESAQQPRQQGEDDALAREIDELRRKMEDNALHMLSFGAMCGAMLGAVGGLSGFVVAGFARRIFGLPGGLGAALVVGGGIVVGCHAAVRAWREGFSWFLLGAVLWGAIWFAGYHYLRWGDLTESLFPWALGATIIAIPGAAHGSGLSFGVGEEKPVPSASEGKFVALAWLLSLLSGLAPRGRGRGFLSGALGGAAGGAVGGCLLGRFSGPIGQETIHGVLGGTLGGAVLGLLGGGFAGVRLIARLRRTRTTGTH